MNGAAPRTARFRAAVLLALGTAGACAPPAATDLDAPDASTLEAVAPEDGATDVPINPVIVLAAEAHLDDTTVSGSGFRLYSGSVNMWLMAHYDPVGRRVVVWPSAKLREGAAWVLEANEGMVDGNGAAVAAGRILGFTSGYATSDDAPYEERRYDGAVRAILDSRCTSCHGGASPMAGLGLDSYAAIEGTAFGVPSEAAPTRERIRPGRPGSSQLIYEVIDDGDGQPPSAGMPRALDGSDPAPLTDDERRALSDWIAAGALEGP